MSEPTPSSRTRTPARWRRPLAIVLVAIVVLLAATRLGGSTASTGFTADAPARDLPRTQLEPTTLSEFEGILVGLRGRPVVVNIWASWCAPCRAEMPLLQRAADTYDGEVTVLGVDSKDSARPAAAFLEDVGVGYPNVFDITGEIRKALGLRGFPTTYFFDARGEIVATVVGGISEARLAAQLDELT